MDGIGQRIRKIRKELGLSQQEFGEGIKVTKAHISKIELSKDNPSDMLIKLICMEYDINEKWLRDGIGEPKDNIFKSDENLADSLGTTFEQLSQELKNKFDIDQFNVYGAVLNESLEKLITTIKNTSNINKGILMLSLKLFFDLLSSRKPDMDIQKGFSEHIHEIIYTLQVYNMLLDDLLLFEHSTEPFDKEGYMRALSKHRNKLLEHYWDLFKLHTKNSKRYSKIYDEIYSELVEPPISAVRESEPIYIPVLNMEILDSINQHPGRINRNITNNDLIPVPIKGEVAAGKPIEIYEYDQGTFMINKKHARYNSFIVCIRGNSMVGADINNGDFVVIRPQPTIENGEIALVNIDGGATIKYFYKTNDGYELRSANQNYAPMLFTEQDNIKIIGKVVDIIKKN